MDQVGKSYNTALSFGLHFKISEKVYHGSTTAWVSTGWFLIKEYLTITESREDHSTDRGQLILSLEPHTQTCLYRSKDITLLIQPGLSDTRKCMELDRITPAPEPTNKPIRHPNYMCHSTGIRVH